MALPSSHITITEAWNIFILTMSEHFSRHEYSQSLFLLCNFPWQMCLPVSSLTYWPRDLGSPLSLWEELLYVLLLYIISVNIGWNWICFSLSQNLLWHEYVHGKFSLIEHPMTFLLEIMMFSPKWIIKNIQYQWYSTISLCDCYIGHSNLLP